MNFEVPSEDSLIKKYVYNHQIVHQYHQPLPRYIGQSELKMGEISPETIVFKERKLP